MTPAVASGLRAVENSEPAKGRLLVARRDMPDARFARSVILLLEHDNEGSLGIIINRPSEIAAAEVLPEIAGLGSQRLFFGGPVALNLLVTVFRNDEAWGGSEQVSGDIYYSPSPNLLEKILARDAPAPVLRLFFGHAGWAAGQLEWELSRGDWHVFTDRAADVFAGNTDRLWIEMIERREPAGLQVRADP